MLAASAFLVATLISGALARETPIDQSTVVNHDSLSRKLMAEAAVKLATCPWASTVCNMNSNGVFLGDTSCVVPIPVPIDNYLDGDRVNKYDTDATRDNSYIQLQSTYNGASMFTEKSSWQKYKRNPTAVQGQISMNTTGVYDLTITAKDYDFTASCSGCVAIRDTYRPRFKTGTCPALPATAPLTVANFWIFNAAETAFDQYVSDNNVDNNGPSPTNGLCNSSVVATRRYLQDSADTATSSCFSTSELAANTYALKVSPLNGTNLGVATAYLEASLNAKCNWCCTKSRTLYENYVPYSCPSTAVQPPATCVGDSTVASSCTMQGCLVAKGTDMMVAPPVLATIRDSVKQTSQKVLDDVSGLSADITRTVLRSIPCVNYDPNSAACKFTTRLTELVDLATLEWKGDPDDTERFIENAAIANTDDYTFWRFSSDGQTWRSLVPTADYDPIEFTDANTTVVLEAWTACGMVSSFTFNVRLILQNSMTCIGFDDIWMPEGPATTSGAYCADANSDFGLIKAELTTEILSTILPMNQTANGATVRADCTISVKDSTVATNPVAVGFLSLNSTNATYFGVDLMEVPTTSRRTTATITCTFVRTSTAANTDAANSITCPPRIITFMDCSPPELEAPDTCLGACKDKLGFGESCGGTVVTSDGSKTTLKPVADQACCNTETCSLACNSVLYGSTKTPIKHCETSIF